MNLYHRLVLPILVVIAAGTLTGCDRREESRGEIRTETRQVGEFDSIEMEGAARLEITVGEPHKLTIEGREAAIDRIHTQVHERTLRIESNFKNWVAGQGGPRITIRIAVPRLAAVKLQGGNDVQLTGFAGGESTIEVEGAANIEGNGHLEALTVHLAGAGHADLGELIADQAKVTVDGVGSVIVHPTERLDATMNGVGAIFYTGSPREVNTRMNGLGTIGKRESKEHSETEQGKPVDPETLQPEYEEPERQKVGETELI